MRKNSPRKWLHAILDLLPVLILPIFGLAVRSDNNFQPIEVQAKDFEVVDFNQQIKNGNFENDNYWYPSSGVTFTINDNSCIVVTAQNYYGINQQIKNATKDHYYFVSISAFSNEITGLNVYVNGNPLVNFIINNSLTHYTAIGISPNNGDIIEITPNSGAGTFTFTNFNIINLTQMFGSGNEPTLQEFNTWYHNEYYDYTLSKKELINVGTTTLSDTDVGSQMVYTLYNATDKYFNFNNVFNFGQIYDWFVLNIFNGNSTLIFPVVWNIVLYEFIMDLVFLIYALFMFFIDFCTNLIDRFHVKCSGGK